MGVRGGAPAELRHPVTDLVEDWARCRHQQTPVHLGTALRTVQWSNGVDKVAFGAEIPQVVPVASLVPAGSHRGHAITRHILDTKADGVDIAEAIMDPGYSLMRPETMLQPLRQAGIEPVFKPVTHQLGRKPLNDDYVLINGQPFSRHTPAELGGEGGQNLALPGPHATAEQRNHSEQEHNRRARYRGARHSRPDRDGYARYKCPFCAGQLHNRELGRRATRKSHTLAALREHSDTCCRGTTTLTAANLTLDQRLPVGTTAWHKSYNRRNLVETANSQLKGRFVDIEGAGFLHVFGLVKRTLLLAGTLAGYNRYAIASFQRKQQAIADQQPRRARRRKRTYQDLATEQTHDDGDTTSGTDPPG